MSFLVGVEWSDHLTSLFTKMPKAFNSKLKLKKSKKMQKMSRRKNR